MKRTIFAVVFCLAAAGTAVAADASLAGLIQAGNRDAALKEIAAGADVNAAQGDGTTPLHWAVHKIDADLARVLLERGAKPDVINSYGSSPLAEAAKLAMLAWSECCSMQAATWKCRTKKARRP